MGGMVTITFFGSTATALPPESPSASLMILEIVLAVAQEADGSSRISVNVPLSVYTPLAVLDGFQYTAACGSVAWKPAPIVSNLISPGASGSDAEEVYKAVPEPARKYPLFLESMLRPEEAHKKPEALGRIRDVRMGPDGFIYLLTDSAQGRVLRMRPAD